MLLGVFLLCWVNIVVVAFLFPFGLAFYFIYLFIYVFDLIIVIASRILFVVSNSQVSRRCQKLSANAPVQRVYLKSQDILFSFIYSLHRYISFHHHHFELISKLDERRITVFTAIKYQ